MSDARASDTNRLVSLVVTYIPHDLATSSVATPLLNNKSKRGWDHNTTAAALCPLKLRTQFLHDPMYVPYSQMPVFNRLTVYRAFRNSVQSGTLRIKTGDYPCFLYPDNAAYNSKDRAKGLFRGHVFIRVHFRCWSVMFPDTSSSEDSPICLHGPFVRLHWSPNCCTCLELRDPRNEGSNS